MEALRLEVTVPKSRKLTLQLPETVSPGDVEVLILHGEQREKAKNSKRASASNHEINLKDLGMNEQQTAELRAKLSSFSDWDDAKMDVYDSYDTAKAKL
jgi:hypothetical protein